ncbi:tRNA (adenosine(37)-N6)-threonylcarbamoyltransferase complex ATPase subunit type 1 TsaE [Gabonibacter massiliensis]|uniref:tRNA (adenosine(37)-N6)-threonylcarbamoyltransferase complex ATPase subunit type 1 TsaE n=1 Tax=Gabonibacter massiliensis TaxID=1720195 RepID=UPI00073E6767|nr:tRNA (adenosine(37)-N6)-threonylcarbamoyltransferase complex ATPase subunit type 1 TsaE [Gabonibacter massiliensis]
MRWIINGLEDLNRVAAEFLERVGDRTLFALYGPMGVGKTTFVKAVAACLGVEDDVTSPTFAIVNEYITADEKRVYHFDFYRVKNTTEAMDFGYEEYFYSGNLCFIEWPEMIEPLLPEDAVICRFSELPDGRRELAVEGM